MEERGHLEDKYKNESQLPERDLWADIEKGIDRKGKRRPFFWWWTSLGVFVLSSGIWLGNEYLNKPTTGSEGAVFVVDPTAGLQREPVQTTEKPSETGKAVVTSKETKRTTSQNTSGEKANGADQKPKDKATETAGSERKTGVQNPRVSGNKVVAVYSSEKKSGNRQETDNQQAANQQTIKSGKSGIGNSQSVLWAKKDQASNLNSSIANPILSSKEVNSKPVEENPDLQEWQNQEKERQSAISEEKPDPGYRSGSGNQKIMEKTASETIVQSSLPVVRIDSVSEGKSGPVSLSDSLAEQLEKNADSSQTPSPKTDSLPSIVTQSPYKYGIELHGFLVNKDMKINQDPEASRIRITDTDKTSVARLAFALGFLAERKITRQISVYLKPVVFFLQDLTEASLQTDQVIGYQSRFDPNGNQFVRPEFARKIIRINTRKLIGQLHAGICYQPRPGLGLHVGAGLNKNLYSRTEIEGIQSSDEVETGKKVRWTSHVQAGLVLRIHPKMELTPSFSYFWKPAIQLMKGNETRPILWGVGLRYLLKS